MKVIVLIVLFACVFVFGASAQKTNDAIEKQIKSLHAEKTITLTYDDGSKASKLFARAENFSDAEARAAGIQAMNFGMAFFYPGKMLSATPESINLTFIVLSKKPQFAAAHKWVVTLPSGPLDLGDARYAAKQGENIEYLNFRIAPADIAKIAAMTDAKFRLGNAEFSFTSVQLATLKNFLAVADPH